MWSTRSEQLADGRILKLFLDVDSSPAPYSEVLRLWQNDAGFRSFFIALLADAPFSAFRWETPPISASTAQRPFEFVLIDSPELMKGPDAAAFSSHFGAAAVDQGVVSFPNLGNDAFLIVSCPRGPQSAYGHLAALVREAPESQKHSLWALVGKAMEQQLGREPIWLSTAGAGVPWLHVRLDQRPKYYGFAAYRSLA